MSDKVIRVKHNGAILAFNEILAKNPSCEVVSAQEAFPERFMPKHTAERVAATKKGKAKAKAPSLLDALGGLQEPPAGGTVPAEIERDASRGL